MQNIFLFIDAILLVVVILLLIFKKGNSDFSLVKNNLERYEKTLKDEFERNRKETSSANAESRTESTKTLLEFQKIIDSKFDNLTKSMQETFFRQQQLMQSNLKTMQESNEKKLDEMRNTVDEKLQSTLENRLTKSFELVTKQLEAVQKGLGEMQNLASDVGGLKRALTSVKSAGGIGEVQLESLLSQILSPEQYEKNAHPNPNNSRNVVEFAVKIPSKDTSYEFIYLPIDSKFPTTVWDNLTLAYEAADKNLIESYKKELISDINKMAKDIKEKYIEVPYTTDFAVMFLPFEGLFAEVIRIPGLITKIQAEYKVTVAGPTTLTALLNSLQMGFRTLAIQKETSKVWELLGTVKTEFVKFGDVLSATKKKLESATQEIEKAETRSRVIEKKLTKVELIPEDTNTYQQNLLTDF